jgi:stearoyl-CoA desaturase (delta-9 desaturase)
VNLPAGIAPLWLLPPIFLLMTLVIGFGVVIGFHRMLTHRAVKFVRPLEIFLVVIGLPAGTPVGWVGHHRHHHAHADDEEDLHSPRHRGFWVAHTGWYLGTTSTTWSIVYALAGPLRTLFDAFWRPRTNQQYAHLARDIDEDPVFHALSKPAIYAAALLGWVVVLWLVVVMLWGVVGVAVMWGFHVMAYNFGDFVNSWGHRWGEQPWDNDDDARDHWLLAILAVGDGWHAGHHAFPSSVRCAFAPGQVDVAYLCCRACERLGLAHSLREPSEADRQRRRRRPTPVSSGDQPA